MFQQLILKGITEEGESVAKIISERSVQLIREHSDGIDLSLPMDDDGVGFAILKYFESMDADIGG